MDIRNCVVIDDEIPAQQLLEKYISRCSSLRHVASFDNAIDSVGFIKEHPVDILFLDIHMPEMTGIELMSALQHPPHVVFTTAYDQFALDGYNLGVVDYLLKPIEYARFLQAVNKIDEFHGNRNPESSFTYFNENHVYHKVYFEDVLYVESQKNYLKIVTRDKEIKILHSLMEMEKKLPNDFLRIHRSYIISKRHIEMVQSNKIVVGGHSIPIGSSYRSKVNELIEE